jgi:tRNA(Ile)-lysidine synthase
VLERVAEIITRYSMFDPGQRVGVAVSGGADSVCLLHILIELAPRGALRLSVLHLDHQLRGEESQEDARFVENLAGHFGLPAHIGSTDVARRCRETGENLEQAARNARREFFLSFLKAGTLDRVALGHTRSDQAETVVFRFLRGSGTGGLAGIRPVTREGFVRPLLAIGRDEVQRYLRERGIAWREDSTNASPAFARNRIRHELLPKLVREWNPALEHTLAHTADWAFEEESYWEAEIERLSRTHLTLRPPAVLLRTSPLADLPKAVARRLVRRAIELAKGDLLTIDFQHIEDIRAMAGGAEGHGRLQIPGVDVFRSFDWLRFAPPGIDTLETRNFRLPLPVPGSLVLPGQDRVISLEVIDNSGSTEPVVSGYNKSVSYLDWGRISGPLELRNWRPGDQYQPTGCAAEEKIKSLFQQARVPLWERRQWPVITLRPAAGPESEIVIWVRLFGPASGYAAGAQSRMILKVRERVGGIHEPAGNV